MRYLFLLGLFLAGCTYPPASKEELKEKGIVLCSCQQGLWYMQGTTAKCNNGTLFFNVNEIDINSQGCR